MAAPAPAPPRRDSIGERLWDFALAAAAVIAVIAEYLSQVETSPSRRDRYPGVPGVFDDHEALEHGSRQGPIVDHATSTSLALGLGMALVVAALAATALLLRRRYPYPAVALAAAAAIIGAFTIDVPLSVSAAFALVLYSFTVERGWVPAAIAGAAASAVVLMGTLIDGSETAAGLFVLFVPVVAVIPVLLGATTRSRRAYLTEVETRLAYAEQERQAVAAKAVADERVNLARDLHDVLAHSLTVVTMQVGVASHLVDSHPDRAKIALDEARHAGAAAMDELRTTLALLRGESPESTSPVPGLADIPALVARVASAGLPVRLVDELPNGTAAGLPDAVGLVAFRLVQEGLTNVVKHAGTATPTTVSLALADDDLVVGVVDAGTPLGAAAGVGGGSGLGLVGLNERVTALGGNLVTGPTPDGGFSLVARLPVPTARSTRMAP